MATIIGKLRKDKDRAKRKNNTRQLASILRELGDHHFDEGKYQEALEEYEELLQIVETLKEDLNSAVAHRMIGETHTSLGNYEEALFHQKQYLKGAKESDNLLEQQRAYATLGRTQFCLSESLSEGESLRKNDALNQAKKSYMKSLELCNTLEAEKVIGLEEIMMMRSRLFLNLGLVFEAKKEPIKAVELIQRAANLCENYGLSEDRYRSHLALGGLYERLKNYDLAQKYYNEATNVNDPAQKSIARLCEVELMIKLGKFSEARVILAQLYVHHYDESIGTTVKKLLRIVAVILLGERDLMNEENNEKRMDIYERMGDAAVAGHCYEKAIDYYTNMLSCAETAGSEMKISAALVSLSQTFKDAERFDEALIFAKRELESCKDSREICRSALFLAELLIETNSPGEKIIDTFQLALENATKADKKSLKLDVLKEMKNYYEICKNTDEAAKLDEEINEIGEVLSVSSSDDSEIENIGMDIDLSDLSDVEDEIAKRDVGESKPRRTSKRGFQVKRNMKGETQLHTACIEGNIKKVQDLINDKHPVNVRDNCGWTPLHEASNFGFVEIVELLLDNGANVNDQGGTECGGVTPLHDAASCGHAIMINLLMERGADPRLKTAKGETVLDCFEAWRKRVTDLSPSDDKEYHCIRERLRLILPPTPKSELSSNANNGRSGSLAPLIDQDEIDSQPMISPGSPIEEKLSASEVYKRTIESIKHPLRMIAHQSTTSKKIAAPLIDNQEVFLDEWLEDDISTASSSKKKRGSCGEDEFGSVKRKSNNVPLGGEKNSKRLRVNEYNTLNILIDNENSRDGGDSLEMVDDSPATFSIFKSKPNSPPILEYDSGFGRKDIPSESIRIQVLLDDRVYNLKLRPSNENRHMIENIENDLATKFELDTGCHGKFRISTSTGEIVCAENILKILYASDGQLKLTGNILDLQVPSIIERYKRIQNNSEDISEKMLKSLKACENTSTFRLKSDQHSDDKLMILLRSLQYENDLQVLHLSTGILFGMGQLLNETLLRLTLLQELHLQGCDINYDCLEKITQLPLQLRVFDISFNPLGQGSEIKLTEFIKPLRYLQTLNLQNCQLKKFPNISVSTSLVNLNVSRNPIDIENIDDHLQRQMVNLNLSKIVGSCNSVGSSMIKSNNELIFLSLDVLELSGCNLTDSEMACIIPKCQNLSKIILSNNPEISVSTLQLLLMKKPTLSYIDISGCALVNENPSDDLIIPDPQMCTLTVSMLSDVSESWKNLWHGQVYMYRLPHCIFVFKPIK